METAKCTFFFPPFFFFLWVKGAGLTPLGAGSGSLLGPPWGGQWGSSACSAQPQPGWKRASQDKVLFHPTRKKVLSGNVNPQVSPFVTFVSLLVVSQQVLGQQGQTQSQAAVGTLLCAACTCWLHFEGERSQEWPLGLDNPCRARIFLHLLHGAQDPARVCGRAAAGHHPCPRDSISLPCLAQGTPGLESRWRIPVPPSGGSQFPQ